MAEDKSSEKEKKESPNIDPNLPIVVEDWAKEMGLPYGAVLKFCKQADIAMYSFSGQKRALRFELQRAFNESISYQNKIAKERKTKAQEPVENPRKEQQEYIALKKATPGS